AKRHRTPTPIASHSLSTRTARDKYRRRRRAEGQATRPPEGTRSSPRPNSNSAPSGAAGKPSSAADLAHRTRWPPKGCAFLDLVLQLLVADRLDQEVRQLGVAGATAQRTPQVPFVDREQTGANLPVRGQSDPVAAPAERLRDRVDEADLADGVREREA